MMGGLPEYSPRSVVAEVILRSLDGRSILDSDTPITAATISAFRVEAEVIRKASEILAGYQFEVAARGPCSLTIVADPSVFEQVFHTRLEAAESASRTLGHYRARGSIEIPADLGVWVAAVCLAEAPELFRCDP